MRTYIIVLGIEPMEVGSMYSPVLHSTIVHWFSTDLDTEGLKQLLTPILSANKPVELRSNGQALYGENEDVPVNTVEKSHELSELHNRLTSTLDEHVTYIKPEYVHDGWHPHVTVQEGRRLQVGESVISEEIYLIEALGDKDIDPKRIVWRFPLGN